jgi:hypothetical protein
VPRPEGRATGRTALGAGARTMASRLWPPNVPRPIFRCIGGGISQSRRRRDPGIHPNRQNPRDNRRAAAARAASIKPDMADTSDEAPIEWNQRPRRECCHTDTPRQAGLPLCNHHAALELAQPRPAHKVLQMTAHAAKVRSFAKIGRSARFGRNRSSAAGPNSLQPSALHFLQRASEESARHRVRLAVCRRHRAIKR